MSKKKSGAYCRRKGHGLEREVANKFKKIGYPRAKRHLEYQSSECKGVDLDNVEPFGIQCKAHKNYVSINTIEEIKSGVPILITKGDRKPAVAVMYLEDLLPYLEKDDKEIS